MIVDEYQNMSAHELETIVTRVGENTHLILCGDSGQTDLKGNEASEHGRIVEILTAMDEFGVYEFGVEDIVRSEFVRRYYEVKELVYKGGLHRTLGV
jgi:phosphate starvation-inducible protein PhoH